MSTSPEIRPATFTQTRLVAINDESVREARQDAEARGYAAGYAAGARVAAGEGKQLRETLLAQADADRAQRDARLEGVISALHAAMRAADDRVVPVIADAQTTLYALAFDLASAIVGTEIAAPSADVPVRQGALWALERVLAEPIEAPELTVRMHPVDVAALQAHWDRVVSVLGRDASRLHLEADHGLASGDAVAVLPHGFLDARLAAAAQRARDELAHARVPVGDTHLGEGAR